MREPRGKGKSTWSQLPSLPLWAAAGALRQQKKNELGELQSQEWLCEHTVPRWDPESGQGAQRGKDEEVGRHTDGPPFLRDTLQETL